MSDAPPSSIHRPADVPLSRNVSFQLMWTSVAAAGFGDRLVQLVAWSLLGYYGQGDRSSIAAGVSFFFFLPWVILGAVAGWLADTLPRKWLLLACDEARAVVMFAGAALVARPDALPPDQAWKAYALLAGVGAFSAIFSPAKAAAVPTIVSIERLQAANAVVLGIAAIASMVGLVVGEPMVTKWSVAGSLAVGGAVFAVSGVFFAFLRIAPTTRAESAASVGGELRRVMDAAIYTVNHKPVYELTVLTVLFWTAAYVVLAAISALCKDRYSTPNASATTMMASLGVGMLVSSVWVAWINSRKENAWFTMIALVVSGASMVGMAASKSYGVALAFSFITGFFGNTAMICVATITQSIAPDYIRGRVFGVRDLASMVSCVAVNYVIWRLPDADRHMIPALYGCAIVLVIVGVRGAARELRRGPMPTAAANVFWRVNRSFVFVWHRLHARGKAGLPPRGPVILVANHTTALDPFLMQAASNRLIRWVMVDKYHFHAFDPLWRACEPIVMKAGAPEFASLRRMIESLGKGDVLGVFPEGGLQRETRELKPFANGAVMLAVRTGAPIVPVWIEGTPCRANVLLHFLQPSRSRVRFGKPYHPDPTRDYDDLTAELRARVMALSNAG